jgi:flavodoxin
MTLEKKFAIYGLGDSSYARLCHAVDVIEDFVKNSLKGTVILEPLRVDSFYFDQKNNEKLVLEWVEKLNQTLG